MSVAFFLSWYFRPYYGYMEWMELQQKQHSSNRCSRSSAPSGLILILIHTPPFAPFLPSLLPSFLTTCEQQVTMSINTSTCIFNWVWSSFFFVFLGYNFCYISQSGDDDPQADFNQIKLKPKYESNYQKSPSIFFLATYLKHACKIWQFFFKFHQQVAIESLQKHLILALFIFYSTFFGYT